MAEEEELPFHRRFGLGRVNKNTTDHARYVGGQGITYKQRGEMKEKGDHRGFDITHIRTLLTKDPSAIATTIALNSNIGQLLDKKFITQDTVMSLTSLLEKVSRCTSHPGNVNQILLAVHNSKFYQHVSTIFKSLGQSGSELDNKVFVSNLLAFLQALFTRLPHSFLDIQVLGIEAMIKGYIDSQGNKSQEEDENIQQTFADLQELKSTVLSNIEQKKQISDKDENPPDDFREISIFPTIEDIYPEDKPFLRKNITTGGYRDLEHYLDVQFRLLREDFICSLRESIEEYLNSEGQGHKHIRVYLDVHIVRLVCTDRGMFHRLRFDASHFPNVRWENSKRLIYGSLVCLSNDNFETFLFATVEQRDPKYLKEGFIDVLFDNVDKVNDINMDIQFTMVETPAFFEAYRHVLRGLQLINRLPFERYIVHCINDVNPPKYLKHSMSPVYDLRPLVDENIVLKETSQFAFHRQIVGYDFSYESSKAKRINILDNDAWPQADMLHLNESQHQALKTALTKEFAIIQGPPGTGKTHVGLKIVKALLHNVKKDPTRTLMMVVCFTNHALDQFLEGIASFFNGNVTRIGSRISIESLKQYSLSEQRQKLRKMSSRDARRARYNLLVKKLELNYEIEQTGMKLEAAGRTILHEDLLKPFMGNHYEAMLQTMESICADMQQNMPKSFIAEWLGLSDMDGLSEDIKREENYPGVSDIIEALEEAEIEEERRLVDDFDPLDNSDSYIDHLKRKIENLEVRKKDYIAFDASPVGLERFKITKHARKQLKKRILRNLRSSQRLTEEERNEINDPWSLPMDRRWQLYKYWADQFCQRQQQGVQIIKHMYTEVVEESKMLRMLEDNFLLRRATVIGMTTTAAARYYETLTDIGPKIIVVEEAAEVLEGHIVTTLSQNCEHLILIGDHKQLKPNPTVYKLAKQFNLDLSLFERMVTNGVHCDSLALQHRMRPEIAALLRPIYPHLQNHPCVSKYEDVRGISHNMFFIDHKNPEEHDKDMCSHSNKYEAEYIVRLCDYLLKQGYERSKITILTTYSGQLLKFKELMPKAYYEGVRLTVVDNYQGEENDIILLSLVRSNLDGSVGFLKIENRVCVALSRAKIGLFVIGNFELLTQQSLLWKEIVEDLRKNDSIGTKLRLFCQNHQSDEKLIIQSPLDFQKAPEGGCMKRCNFRLDCGHVCALLCHPYDPEHKQYQCKKTCQKVLCDREHKCQKMCHEDCGPCRVLVEKIIPKCGHTQWVYCELDPNEFCCRNPCIYVLECGHVCGMQCGMDHMCIKKCDQQLVCGHICEGNCKTCHEGRLHQPCKKDCNKTLICHHKCRGQCSECLPCNKTCENMCAHTKCKQLCCQPCTPCLKECKWECNHYKCTMPCSEPCNRPPCNKPCPKQLLCKHPCIGLCGEPCPDLCRICDNEKVCQIVLGSETKLDARFVVLQNCSHIIEVARLDSYMKTESNEIGLKVCPQCNTPIRNNMRYGDIIKKSLWNVEIVKGHFSESRKKFQLKMKSLQKLFNDMNLHDQPEMNRMMSIAQNNGSLARLYTLENVYTFIDGLSKIISKYNKLEEQMQKTVNVELPSLMNCIQEAKACRLFLLKERSILSDQEKSDVQKELLRHKAIVSMMRIQLDTQASQSINDHLLSLKSILMTGKPLTEERQKGVRTHFESIAKHGHSAEDMVDETVRTVHSVTIATDQWVPCENGHALSVVAEGECAECEKDLLNRVWFTPDH